MGFIAALAALVYRRHRILGLWGLPADLGRYIRSMMLFLDLVNFGLMGCQRE